MSRDRTRIHSSSLSLYPIRCRCLHIYVCVYVCNCLFVCIDNIMIAFNVANSTFLYHSLLWLDIYFNRCSWVYFGYKNSGMRTNMTLGLDTARTLSLSFSLLYFICVLSWCSCICVGLLKSHFTKHLLDVLHLRTRTMKASAFDANVNCFVKLVRIFHH